MNRIPSRCTSPWLLLALAFFPFTWGNGTETIPWTSRDGGTIHARLVGMDGSRVFLERGGRYHDVPFEVLSDASIAKARRLLNDTTAAGGHTHGTSDARGTATVSTRRPSAAMPAPHAVAHTTNRSLSPGGPTRVVRTTAYSCAEADHAPFGSLSAVGTPLRYGPVIRSAAADWSVYPVGTVFRIKGLPWLYIIDDYGSALVGTATIDLYKQNLSEMRRWGCRKVEITIVRWGCYRTSARILSPRIRHDHCRSMLLAIKSRTSIP